MTTTGLTTKAGLAVHIARLFHRHHWRAVATQQGTYVLLGGDGTAVLYRCDCGRHRTATINGHWTTAQLRAGR